MSNDNGGAPPQGQQPPYPGAPVPPRQPYHPPAAPGSQQPSTPAYPGAIPPRPAPPQPTGMPQPAPSQNPWQQPPIPAYPGAAPAYPGSTPTAPGAHPGSGQPGYAQPGYTQPGAGYPAPAYGQPYGQPYAAPLKSNGLAVGSMICGIAAVLFLLMALIPFVGIFPLLIAVAAVVLGHLGLRSIARDRGVGGRGMAITGLVTGYIAAGVCLLSGAFWVIAIIASAASGNSGY